MYKDFLHFDIYLLLLFTNLRKNALYFLNKIQLFKLKKKRIILLYLNNSNKEIY